MVSDSIDLHADHWSKQKQEDIKYLSKWKDQIKELVVERISSLKEKVRSSKQKILDDPDVKDTLRRPHDDFVLVPTDKAASNVIVVCKGTNYIETLMKELGINPIWTVGPVGGFAKYLKNGLADLHETL